MQTRAMRSEFAVTSEPTSDLESATLALLNDFARTSLSREHSNIFEEFTGVSLPTSDLRLLEHLNGREPVSASAIATALTTDPSRTSRQTRRLERAGYLARLSDPADGRRTLLHLTAQAQAVMDTSLLRFTDRYLQATSSWTDGEIVEVEQWLRQVYDGLTRWLPDRPTSAAGRVWRQLVEGSGFSQARLELGVTAIQLFTWISQAHWFEYLLQSRSVPLSQQLYITLCAIDRHGPLSVAELAGRTWVDHTQASKRVSRLAGLNLVDRAADSFDRRSSLVRCSRSGVALVRRLADEQLADLRTATGPVDESSRPVRTDLMRRLLRTLVERGQLIGP